MNANRAALALAFGVVAAFVVTAMPLPFWYLPMHNVLAIGVKPKGLVIDYYGRVLGVVIAAALGFALGKFAPPSTRFAKLCLVWAAFGALLAIGLSMSQVWNRPLQPITLPVPK
jgi:hypothetical protein